jgi:alpha-galactosidase
MRHEIFLYKRTRPILREAVPLLLTEQIPAGGRDGWDVVQFVSADTGNVALHACAATTRSEATTVRLQALDPAALYQIYYRPPTPPAEVSGARIMDDGVEILSAPDSAAHLFLLFKRSPAGTGGATVR